MVIKFWVMLVQMVQKTTRRLRQPLQNQAGLQAIEILGWSLVGVLVIVVAWGLISGWIPTFIQKIFGKLDALS